MDLTGILKVNTPGQAVDAWHESKHKPRAGLGLSEVGHECHRYLWYSYNNIKGKDHPSGRVLRLFRMGDLIEENAVIDLMSAGYHIHSRQKEISFTYDDITLKGHIDGVIEGLIESSRPHLLECKSANEKSFNECKKVGYEKWDEKYKGQIHVYMLGMKLKRCLVWVENKNTSEVYTESISLDREYAINLLESVFLSLKLKKPPERKCPAPTWYKAKWCKFYKICF